MRHKQVVERNISRQSKLQTDSSLTFQCWPKGVCCRLAFSYVMRGWWFRHSTNIASLSKKFRSRRSSQPRLVHGSTRFSFQFSRRFFRAVARPLICDVHNSIDCTRILQLSWREQFSWSTSDLTTFSKTFYLSLFLTLPSSKLRFQKFLFCTTKKIKRYFAITDYCVHFAQPLLCGVEENKQIREWCRVTTARSGGTTQTVLTALCLKKNWKLIRCVMMLRVQRKNPLIVLMVNIISTYSQLSRTCFLVWGNFNFFGKILNTTRKLLGVLSWKLRKAFPRKSFFYWTFCFLSIEQKNLSLSV